MDPITTGAIIAGTGTAAANLYSAISAAGSGIRSKHLSAILSTEMGRYASEHQTQKEIAEMQIEAQKELGLKSLSLEQARQTATAPQVTVEAAGAKAGVGGIALLVIGAGVYLYFRKKRRK